jgi:ubiquinone/menaquinone biosynthesis C-methylase UbiE
MNDHFSVFHRWFPDELNHDTGFHQIVGTLIPAKGKILDLGCGSNETLARYRSADREVWGADFEAHPAMKNAAWFRPLATDGAIPFADNTFDLVTTYMVMEHVAAPAKFFGEIARVLKPSGVYVGQSIHSLHYVTWIRRLFDLAPHSWVQRLVKKLYGREEHDTFPTCYRLNRRGSIARFASDCGLEELDWHSYASQGYFRFAPLLFRSAVLVDWSLERIHPGFGKLYFTVTLRKSGAQAATTDGTGHAIAA